MLHIDKFEYLRLISHLFQQIGAHCVRHQRCHPLFYDAVLCAEMPPASFPIVYMGMDGMAYNELHGYAQPMNTVFMRDTITGLDSGRSTEFTIDITASLSKVFS